MNLIQTTTYDARGWRSRDFVCETQNKIQNPFFKVERKCVLWVLNYKEDVYVMNILNGIWEKNCICVEDLAQ